VSAVADQYRGRIKVGKLDAYANMDVAVRLGVLGLPTLLLFKRGEVKERLVGLVTVDQIAAAIDRNSG